MKNERGSMLIIALWTLSILSLLALGAGTSAWTEMKLTSLQLDQIRAQRLLQGSLTVARETLSLTSANSVHSYRDAWGHEGPLTRKVALPDGYFSFERQTSGQEPAWGLEDEQGRLNINYASPETLLRLLGDDQQELVNAIVAWRGIGSQPEGMDEMNDYYEALPIPYDCKRAPLESVEELLLVRGMTLTLFQKMQPYVTVYTNGLMNINTAPRPVLLALGFDEDLADRVLAHRAGPDGKEGTEDDSVFQTVAGIIPDLSQEASLLVDELAQISAIQSRLTVRSTCFRAHAVFSATDDFDKAVTRADVVLAASGLQGQWIIKHYSTL